jgi:hypothetical protein
MSHGYTAYLVNEDSDHVTICSFEGAEGTAEVKEHVVLLALHADTQEDAT